MAGAPDHAVPCCPARATGVPASFDMAGQVPVAVGKCVGMTLPPELGLELAEALELDPPPLPGPLPPEPPGPAPVEPLDVLALPACSAPEEHPAATAARIVSGAAKERSVGLMKLPRSISPEAAAAAVDGVGSS